MTVVSDAFIDSCGFRMFELPEIARTMVMAEHPHGADEPAKTITTRDRLALLVPPSSNGSCRDAHTEPSFVQVTETRPSLVEVPE